MKQNENITVEEQFKKKYLIKNPTTFDQILHNAYLKCSNFGEGKSLFAFNGNKLHPEPTNNSNIDRASKAAINFCKENPGWKRICDITNTEKYYQSFSDLSRREKMYWIGKYKSRYLEAWNEFGV